MLGRTDGRTTATALKDQRIENLLIIGRARARALFRTKGSRGRGIELAASESKEYCFRPGVRPRVVSAFDDRIRLHLVASTETPRKLGTGRFGNLELLTL